MGNELAGASSGMNRPDIPHRRHQLTLKLEADDIPSLLSAIAAIEYDLIVKEAEHDWTHPVEITSGGYDSGWHLNITSDLSIEGDAYRASLKAWSAANRAAREGLVESAATGPTYPAPQPTEGNRLYIDGHVVGDLPVQQPECPSCHAHHGQPHTEYCQAPRAAIFVNSEAFVVPLEDPEEGQ